MFAHSVIDAASVGGMSHCPVCQKEDLQQSDLIIMRQLADNLLPWMNAVEKFSCPAFIVLGLLAKVFELGTYRYRAIDV
jgi:recombinational DNA repair protein RecR